MAKHGKLYNTIATDAPQDVLELDQAIAFIKEHPGAKFDETVEMAFALGVDPKKSDQAIRQTVALPHGTGKNVRVVVFAAGDAAEAAKSAGATEVGFEDLIEKVKGGWTDFDVAVATPEAMKEVKKLGRVLGPRGLMPNPKTGTVTDDTAAAVTQCQAGRVEFRMDRHGNVHMPFGKLSFDADKLVENAEVAIAAVQAERPSSIKGTYIKKCTVSSTMGVGLAVNIRT